MLVKESIIYILLITSLFLSLLYSDRHSLYFDATNGKRHQLSNKSLNLINSFTEDVFIDIYSPDIKLLNQVRDEIDIYEHNSNGKLIVSFHNRAPATGDVKNKHLNLTNLLVASYKGEQQYIDIQKNIIAEANFMKMLETLKLQQDNWVVFSLGNGERNPFSNNDKDIGFLMSLLQQQGIKVASFNLDELFELPSNTSVLIFAGPSIEMSDNSKNMVRRYVKNGGNLLWLVQTGQPRLFDFLNDIVPIRVDDNISVDKAHAKYGLPSPGLVLGNVNQGHDIYPGVDSSILFPWAHKLSSIGSLDDWLVRDIVASNKKDILAIEAKRGDQSISVFGSVDFISNGVIENYANINTAINIIRLQHMGQKPMIFASSENTNFVVSDNHDMIVKYLFQVIIPIMLLIPVIIRACRRLVIKRRFDLRR